MQATATKTSERVSFPALLLPSAVVLDLMLELRDVSVSCVEAIGAWHVRARPGASGDARGGASGTETFLWNGVDYLAKMHHDLDFLAGRQWSHTHPDTHVTNSLTRDAFAGGQKTPP